MILICILVSVLIMLSPISACAAELELQDPVEVNPTFLDYEILGYDGEGNIVLSPEDYQDYLDKRISGEYGIATMSLLEEALAAATRLIPLPTWLDFALDFALDMLFEPTLSAGEENSFTANIDCVGKKEIVYTNSGVTELVTLRVRTSPVRNVLEFNVMRTSSGVSTYYYGHQQPGSNVTFTFESGYYYIYTPVDFLGGTTVQSGILCVNMIGSTVNSLPRSETTVTAALPDNNNLILGQYSTNKAYRIPAAYAENTFVSNDYTYTLSHSTSIPANVYYQNCVINSPLMTSTKITVDNISQYSQYGYSYNSVTNSIDVDTDVLLAYIQNVLLAQWELQYRNTYDQFPEPGATFGEGDQGYQNPFEEDTTQPPATLPGGSGGGLTPEQLESILQGDDTYYILDVDTYPDIALDTLPTVYDFSPDVISASSGLADFVVQLFSAADILPIFVTLSVLAFVVFVMLG